MYLIFFYSYNIGLIINQPVGPDPTRLTCPTCHKEIITNVEIVASTKTHIMAGILCLLG